ncbi:MAG: PhzF family phenazine biosynthesis protein [Acidimicrobiales bacterium]
MTLELTVVDAFTSEPFAGNPAAVAVIERFLDDRTMQLVAREMNLSETAFVVARPDGDHDLRWFTPTVEVELCGHATLASAHVLGGTARFHTRSGALGCTGGGDAGMILMDFPADPPVASQPPTGFSCPGMESFAYGRSDAVIELVDAASVRRFEPDLGALASLGTRTVAITAAGDRPGIDCVSRVFAPNAGINEDPATGSVHCTLAAFWAQRTGRSRFVGEQASPRGATIHMQLQDGRVVLGGHAITTARVTMLL